MRLVYLYYGLAAVLLNTSMAAEAAYPGSSSQVSIIDNGYSPGNVSVYVGDTVMWSNTGKRAHTTTSDSGAWNSGTIGAGGTFTFTFNQAGTFAYHCAFHEEMHGTITVQPLAVHPTATAVAASAPAPTPMPAVAPLAPATAQPAAAAAVPTLIPTVATLTTQTVDPAIGSGAQVPDGYRLGVTRIQLNVQPAGAAFPQASNVSVFPSDADVSDVGGDPSSLVLARLSADLSAWEVLSTSTNDDGSLSAAVNGPGTFAVLETASP
jgi:plastocyanin